MKICQTKFILALALNYGTTLVFLQTLVKTPGGARSIATDVTENEDPTVTVRGPVAGVRGLGFGKGTAVGARVEEVLLSCGCSNTCGHAGDKPVPGYLSLSVA